MKGKGKKEPEEKDEGVYRDQTTTKLPYWHSGHQHSPEAQTQGAPQNHKLVGDGHDDGEKEHHNNLDAWIKTMNQRISTANAFTYQRLVYFLFLRDVKYKATPTRPKI